LVTFLPTLPVETLALPGFEIALNPQRRDGAVTADALKFMQDGQSMLGLTNRVHSMRVQKMLSTALSGKAMSKAEVCKGCTRLTTSANCA
jgi:hypothetical protein